MGFKQSVLGVVGVLIVLSGCNKTVDDTEAFNKPAFYWYKQIAKSISNDTMDKADTLYVSLRSEHMRSPLMPTAMMMLAHAHMDKEEYMLANYYLDEYNKRYAEGEHREYTEFLKLKASFLGIKDIYKDQKLIIDTIRKAKTYLYRYPGSEYTAMINTILVRLHMTQYLLNENIAALYDRTGKSEAAKIYRAKNKNSMIELTDMNAPKQGFIGAIFD